MILWKEPAAKSPDVEAPTEYPPGFLWWMRTEVGEIMVRVRVRELRRPAGRLTAHVEAVDRPGDAWVDIARLEYPVERIDSRTGEASDR